ncbi:unnamed protein product [Didymodactylos carnosus]|nr:unnamed protein product [Didymodactylos carnosus]CAF4402581.1 unnamed protein product [Didymodactylos carnosus]
MEERPLINPVKDKDEGYSSLPAPNSIIRSWSSNASVVSSASGIDLLGEELTSQKFGRLYRRYIKCINRTTRQTKPRQVIHFEQFFCTHAPLIERHFYRIMVAAENNITDKNAFAPAVLEKYMAFKDEINILYTRPRLLSPAWYNFTQEQQTTSKRRLFAEDLCAIIEMFTAPKFGNFLNCVLSALLSYQLSWLSTVAPSRVKSKYHFLSKNKADYTGLLQQIYQYSPLWAQLIDLYSAYGQPPCICRTIIVGTDPTLVSRLLYLLSYFIRPSYLTYQEQNYSLVTTNNNVKQTENDNTNNYTELKKKMSDLITQATQIQNVDPFSPVQSDDEDSQNNDNNNDDFYNNLTEDEQLEQESFHQPQLTEQQQYYQLEFSTYNGDDTSLSSTNDVNEQEIQDLLNTLIIQIEQIQCRNEQKTLINSNSSYTPKKIEQKTKLSNTIYRTSTPSDNNQQQQQTITNKLTKRIMLMPLFEPQPVTKTYDENGTSGTSTELYVLMNYHKDLALSLIGSLSTVYSSDFILQGIELHSPESLLKLRQTIINQLRHDIEDGGAFLSDEAIDESICLIINTDQLNVELYSSKHSNISLRQEATTVIQTLIEQIKMKIQLPADFFVLNLEDYLQEIYFLALAVLKYMKTLDDKATHRDISRQESNTSLATSSSTAKSDNDNKISIQSSHISTVSPSETTKRRSTIIQTNYLKNSSSIVCEVMEKFHLKRSDWLFLKNILKLLEDEQFHIGE